MQRIAVLARGVAAGVAVLGSAYARAGHAYARAAR